MCAGRAQPGGGALGQAEQLAPDDTGIVDVAGERLLRADALVRLVRHDAALVTPPRQRGQVPACGRTECALQGGCGGVGDVTDRAQPELRFLSVEISSDEHFRPADYCVERSA